MKIKTYIAIYDNKSKTWEDDKEYNIMFLKRAQNYTYEYIQHKGYIYLNQILDMLGLDEIQQGQELGWKKDSISCMYEFGYLFEPEVFENMIVLRFSKLEEIKLPKGIIEEVEI